MFRVRGRRMSPTRKGKPRTSRSLRGASLERLEDAGCGEGGADPYWSVRLWIWRIDGVAGAAAADSGRGVFLSGRHGATAVQIEVEGDRGTLRGRKRATAGSLRRELPGDCMQYGECAGAGCDSFRSARAGAGGD